MAISSMTALLPRASGRSRGSHDGWRTKISVGLSGLQVVREGGHELVTLGERGAGLLGGFPYEDLHPREQRDPRRGQVAELEAKALRPEKWKEALDEYEKGVKDSRVDPRNPVARLLRQMKAGKGRGHKVYVAISDGTSMRSRERLLVRLRPTGFLDEELLLLPESEILRVGKILREHMGIPQPTFPTKGDG